LKPRIKALSNPESKHYQPRIKASSKQHQSIIETLHQSIIETLHQSIIETLRQSIIKALLEPCVKV
jgi:hypothetical protein